MWVVDQTHALAHLNGAVELVQKEPFVDFAVFEAEHFHGDAIRLTEARDDDVAVVISDSDCIASLQAFGGIMDGTRKHPRVKTAQSNIFALPKADDRI